MYDFLQIKNISKSFNNINVLKNINMHVSPNEQAVLRGPSGSGKSTLLYLIGGLDLPDSGEILFKKDDITKFNDQDLSEYRNRHIGFVFQFHYLLNSLSCIENILLPARVGTHNLIEIENSTQVFAKELGVHKLLKKYPHELSGGEQQRINILRAISLKPKLLLCDEPTGNLDSENSKTVITLLKDLAHESRSALLVVTHDDEISNCFTHHYNIKDGEIN